MSSEGKTTWPEVVNNLLECLFILALVALFLWGCQ